MLLASSLVNSGSVPSLSDDKLEIISPSSSTSAISDGGEINCFIDVLYEACVLLTARKHTRDLTGFDTWLPALLATGLVISRIY